MRKYNPMRRLQKRQNELLKTLSMTEVLSSAELQRYLTSIAQTVSGHCGSSVEVQLLKLDSDTVAFMNQDTIVVNIQSELLDFFTTLDKKIMCMLGLVVHEAAHKRYLDLPKLSKIHQMRLKGKWISDTSTADPCLLEIEDYVNDANNNGAVSKIIAKMAWDINNILADVHDENAIVAKFPGTPAKALAYPQVALYEDIPVFEDEIKREMTKTQRLSFLFSLILRYARFHDIKINSDECWDNEFVLKLNECIDHIEDGVEESDVTRRQDSVDNILFACWPFIKEAIDEMKEDASSDNTDGSNASSDSDASSGSAGSSGQSADGTDDTDDNNGQASGNTSNDTSSMGSISDEALEELLGALDSSAKETKSTTPTNISSSPSESSAGKKATPSGVPSLTEDEELAKRTMSQICAEIAERKASEEAEDELMSDIKVQVNAVDKNDGHRGINVSVHRTKHVCTRDIEEYNKISQKILPTSKIVQRRLLQALKNNRQGGKSYGEIIGRKFEGKCACRVDGRYYSKTNLPTEEPQLAVGILVDESGSMWGERVDAAREMAIVCEDFTRNLDIPTLICGHSTASNGEFALYSYVEFDSVDKKDKYRLMDITARRNNRDGLALKIMCERMVKRPEEVKLLIVISDGQPNDYNYGGESAEKEMREICKKYRRKGVTIFGAAIGHDKENIKRIYGDGFLDIADLSALPNAMVKLIRKHIKT